MLRANLGNRLVFIIVEFLNLKKYNEAVPKKSMRYSHLQQHISIDIGFSFHMFDICYSGEYLSASPLILKNNCASSLSIL